VSDATVVFRRISQAIPEKGERRNLGFQAHCLCQRPPSALFQVIAAKVERRNLGAVVWRRSASASARPPPSPRRLLPRSSDSLSFLSVKQGVPQGRTESGGIVLAAICWAASAQRRCYPTGRCRERARARERESRGFCRGFLYYRI
jgi:hypothetical protein